MATASHNPPQYHGFKLYDGSGGSVSSTSGLQELAATVARDPALPPAALAPPEPLPATAVDAYLEFATAHVDPAVRGMRVVIDASNGSAGALLTAAAERLGLDAVILNAAPDGTFPAHPPNPLEPASRQQTAAAVVRTGAVLGAVLDGDGDRILICDETGRVVESSFGRHPDRDRPARTPRRRRNRVRPDRLPYLSRGGGRGRWGTGQGAGGLHFPVRKDGALRCDIRQ